MMFISNLIKLQKKNHYIFGKQYIENKSHLICHFQVNSAIAECCVQYNVLTLDSEKLLPWFNGHCIKLHIYCHP